MRSRSRRDKPSISRIEGRCLIALQRPREAFEAANKALRARAARRVDARHDRRRHDARGRARRSARAVPPRCCARSPAKLPTTTTSAASLQFVGELKAAEDEYRHALRLEPRFHRAWSSLAQVARAPLSRSRDRDARARARRPGDRRGRRAASVPRAREATRGRGPIRNGVSPARARQAPQSRHAAATISAPTEALFAAAERLPPALTGRDGEGCASREPIFIVGMPRTGTTLVERILSSHPSVFSAGELTNFGLVLKRATGTRVEPRPRRRNAGGRRALRPRGRRRSLRREHAAAHGPHAAVHRQDAAEFFLRAIDPPRFAARQDHLRAAQPARHLLEQLSAAVRDELLLLQLRLRSARHRALLRGVRRADGAVGARRCRRTTSRFATRTSSTTPSKKRAASSSSASCPGTRAASPSKTTPRPSRRRAPCRSGNRSTVRASSGGGTTSASLRRCGRCSSTPACCDGLLDCPPSGRSTRVSSERGLSFPHARARVGMAAVRGLLLRPAPRRRAGVLLHARRADRAPRRRRAARQLVVSAIASSPSRWRSSAAFGFMAAKPSACAPGAFASCATTAARSIGGWRWRASLAALVAGLPAGLGLWWSVFDSRRRGWHDRWTRTRVVRAEPPPKR